MRRARALHFYTPASTANPTGMRPWNSRLSFYTPGAYPLPTTGTGIPAQRFAAGGLGSIQFPNFAGFNRARTWRTRDNASSPTPWIYATERHGLGAMPVVNWPRQLPRGAYNPIPSGATPIVSTQPQTGTNAPAPTNQICPAWGCGPAPVNRYQFHNWAPTGTGQSGSFVTSSPETGSIVSYQPNTGTPIYPYGQQPSSASAAATAIAPASSVIIGYDANGNPVYQGQTVSSAGLPIASTTPPAAAGTSWFSQDSLGLGLSNGVYAAIGVGLVLMFKKK
jgi:hypothetical protein